MQEGVIVFGADKAIESYNAIHSQEVCGMDGNLYI